MKSLKKAMIAFFVVFFVAICVFLTCSLTGGSMGAIFFSAFSGPINERRLIQTQTVEMKDITELNIENNSSNVYFISSDQDEMVIKEYAVSRTIKDSFVTVRKDGNQLNIESTRIKSRRWFVFGGNYRYFEVYLPMSYKGSLSLDSGSGDVQAKSDVTFSECSVQTLSGDIDFLDLTADRILLSAGSGDISARRLKGEKELSTRSGSIDIYGNEGAATITVTSGDVRVDQSEGGLGVHTTSGDIDVRVTNLNGNLDIQCTSGDIDCELPETAGFQFKAGTSSGDINTDFDQDLNFDRKGKNAEGMVGAAAEFTVNAHTGSGDIDFSFR